MKKIRHKATFDYVRKPVKDKVLILQSVIKQIHYFVLSDTRIAEFIATLLLRLWNVCMSIFYHTLPVKNGKITFWFWEKCGTYSYETYNISYLIRGYTHFHCDGNSRTARLLANLKLIKAVFFTHWYKIFR